MTIAKNNIGLGGIGIVRILIFKKFFFLMESNAFLTLLFFFFLYDGISVKKYLKKKSTLR